MCVYNSLFCLFRSLQMMAGVVAMAAVIEDFDIQVFPVWSICL